ncbi:hypothetical protein [Enterococcus sp. DIV0756]
MDDMRDENQINFFRFLKKASTLKRISSLPVAYSNTLVESYA